jgi:hypothetical protein
MTKKKTDTLPDPGIGLDQITPEQQQAVRDAAAAEELLSDLQAAKPPGLVPYHEQPVADETVPPSTVQLAQDLHQRVITATHEGRINPDHGVAARVKLAEVIEHILNGKLAD